MARSVRSVWHSFFDDWDSNTGTRVTIGPSIGGSDVTLTRVVGDFNVQVQAASGTTMGVPVRVVFQVGGPGLTSLSGSMLQGAGTSIYGVWNVWPTKVARNFPDGTGGTSDGGAVERVEFDLHGQRTGIDNQIRVWYDDISVVTANARLSILFTGRMFVLDP